jgi:hypothetical protein
VALQVGYLLNKAQKAYDDELFKGLAQDLFHLRPPPEGVTAAADLPQGSTTTARPTWMDKLKADADPQAFHNYAVDFIAK